MPVVQIRDPDPVVPAAARSPYPWAAVLAATLAGIIVGGVAGYRIGLWRAAPDAVRPHAGSSVRAETDVPISVEPSLRRVSCVLPPPRPGA